MLLGACNILFYSVYLVFKIIMYRGVSFLVLTIWCFVYFLDHGRNLLGLGWETASSIILFKNSFWGIFLSFFSFLHPNSSQGWSSHGVLDFLVLCLDNSRFNIYFAPSISSALSPTN